jgi:hypothetical protein
MKGKKKENKEKRKKRFVRPILEKGAKGVCWVYRLVAVP